MTEVHNEDRSILLQVDKRGGVGDEVGNWHWRQGLHRVEYPDKADLRGFFRERLDLCISATLTVISLKHWKVLVLTSSPFRST